MKKIFCIMFSIFVVCLSAVPAFAEVTNTFGYVSDKADVLTDAQEKELNDKLTDFREKNKFDVVIVTSTGVLPDERMAYADDFYDYNNYGYGKNRDGVLLLVNIGTDGIYTEGNSWVSTCGKGIKYISDEKIAAIGRELTPLLISGSYNDALNLFPDLVKADISASIRRSCIFIIVFTVIVSVISAFLYGAGLKKKLHTVEEAAEADEYIRNDSLRITRSYDHFLYANVTRVKRESSNNSSTHTSSSGTTHGGGGF